MVMLRRRLTLMVSVGVIVTLKLVLESCKVNFTVSVRVMFSVCFKSSVRVSGSFQFCVAGLALESRLG